MCPLDHFVSLSSLAETDALKLISRIIPLNTSSDRVKRVVAFTYSKFFYTRYIHGNTRKQN